MGELWKRLTERQKKIFPWLAAILMVGAGILLLQPTAQPELASLPRQQPVEVPVSSVEESLKRELAEILNAMLGAKRCSVFLTMDSQYKLTLAYSVTEEERTSPEGLKERRLTSAPVILRNDGERKEAPLVIEELEPQVRGVLVVVDEEPSAELRLAVAQAVATALQLPMYRIEVAFKK